MAQTLKLGSTKRFGARYGTKIRKQVAKVEARQNAKTLCPICKLSKIKRIASGIYICNKCNNKMTGKAYTLD